jgi:dihydrofolate synthase/folylpolyglutamate synthase
MRFGLERIRRLVGVLGMPQHRFASIHVVGTNGKSSVTEATAALLAAHGVRSGAYLSPHGERWAERVRIGGADLGGEAFASSVERVAESVGAVNRALDEGDEVTQFEAATAAAFVALAAAGVEVGVIEAGLGGRLDATNVLPSRVTVLTSVGLDHTQWLGESVAEIAAEKLAVLRDHATLVAGPLDPDLERLASEVADARSAGFVRVRDLSPAVELASSAPYARRNFAVASFCFRLYLVLHACAVRFDVMRNLEIFLEFGGN